MIRRRGGRGGEEDRQEGRGAGERDERTGTMVGEDGYARRNVGRGGTETERGLNEERSRARQTQK